MVLLNFDKVRLYSIMAHVQLIFEMHVKTRQTFSVGSLYTDFWVVRLQHDQ